jgi:hypothetical protein
LLQLFFCYDCEESYEPFAPSILLRFVPLPPATPTPGQEVSPDLLADVAANEDPAAQLAKRPRDDDQRRESASMIPKGHFPFRKLVNWTPREDWPEAIERRGIAGAEGIDPANDLPTADWSCKLGGWAPWVQGGSHHGCHLCVRCCWSEASCVCVCFQEWGTRRAPSVERR